MQYLARLRLAAPVLLATLLLASCGDDDESGPDGGGQVDAGISALCLEATEHSDFAWIQANVFNRSCANFSSCHNNTSGKPAEELNLAMGKAYLALVDHASEQRPEMKLVKPGDPAHSYLMIKLGDGDQALRIKDTMPQNNPLLCQEKRDAIKRWIERGAPETETEDDAGVGDASL